MEEYKGFRYRADPHGYFQDYAILEFDKNHEFTVKCIELFNYFYEYFEIKMEGEGFLYEDSAHPGFLKRYGFSENTLENHIEAIKILAKNQIDQFYEIRKNIDNILEYKISEMKEQVNSYKEIVKKQSY